MGILGFRYRIAPTAAHIQAFREFSGVCRLIYNLALEQRSTYWRQYHRQTGRRLGYADQCRELTALRAEYDWIAAVSQTCQQQALRDLDRAFANFFSDRAKYPTPRRKGVNDGFRFQGRELEVRRLNAKWSSVRLPKVGWVKFRDTRPMRGAILNATLSHDPLGWHISFACESECVAPPSDLPSVGIDRGVVNTLALSTGEFMSLPLSSLATADRRLRKAQRIAARRRRGSIRRAKAQLRVSRLSAARARVRRDWHHKAALNIASRFGVVVLEDLKVSNMTASARGTRDDPGHMVRQKAGLNRSILNQGWSAFEAILAYKLDFRGGLLMKVNPAFTSQTCSDCGAVDKQSRESQARFVCRHCGFRAHADHNAAINILRRNTASMRMEEGHLLSGEVRTRRALVRPENPPVLAGGRC